MLGEHATHPEGGYGIEAGITEMLTLMQTGASRCSVATTSGLRSFATTGAKTAF